MTESYNTIYMSSVGWVCFHIQAQGISKVKPLIRDLALYPGLPMFFNARKKDWERLVKLVM